MEMDWHAIVGISAPLIGTVAFIPYVLSIIRRESKPNVVSWSIWTAVVLIVMAGQISAGASWSILILVSSTLQNFVILFFCARGYGYKHFGRVDQISLGIAVLAILLWLVTSNPLIAIIFAVSADAIGYIPTYVKTYREPRSESLVYWGALVVTDMLAAISVTKPDLANLLFPVVFGFSNLAVFAFAFFGRRQTK